MTGERARSLQHQGPAKAVVILVQRIEESFVALPIRIAPKAWHIDPPVSAFHPEQTLRAATGDTSWTRKSSPRLNLQSSARASRPPSPSINDRRSLAIELTRVQHIGQAALKRLWWIRAQLHFCLRVRSSHSRSRSILYSRASPSVSPATSRCSKGCGSGPVKTASSTCSATG